MLTVGDVFSPLPIDILNGRIDVLHEQHLTNLKMVSLRSEVETTASDRVLVVEVRPFVSEQQIDYPRLPVPTSDFERDPLLSTENIWIDEFLENQVIDCRGIAYRASDVQRWKLVVTQHAEINLNILWLYSRHDLASFRTTVDLITFLSKGATLCVQNPGLLDLILHDQSYQLLFVAVFSDHVADFVYHEHIVYLFSVLNYLLFIGFLSLRVFLRGSKSRYMITILQLHGWSSDHRARRVLGPSGVSKFRIPQIRSIRLGHNDRVSSRSIPTLNSLHLLLLLVLIRKQTNFIKEFPISLLGMILLLPSKVLLFLVSGILVLEVHILSILMRVL